jgi:hypothetical protein
VNNLLSTSSERPTLDVGVIMRREAVPGPMSQWQPWRWLLADVVRPQDLGASPQEWSALGTEPVPIELNDADTSVDAPVPQHWLYPGMQVELFRDDTEGYYLNLTSPTPCFWVLWRLEPHAPTDELPQPLIVTVSYHDAGRWLDAQERVDQVPVPPAVRDWLAAYTQAHYIPEPKKRVRPASFQPLQDRFGNPVSISTEKMRGGQRRGGEHGE